MTMVDRITEATHKALGNDYATALAVADQAMAMAADLPAPPPNPHADPVDAGKVTAAWVDSEVDHQLAAEDRTQRFNVLVGLARDCRGRADLMRASRANAVLTALHGLLADLVADVAAISSVIGPEVSSIAAAVAAGHGNAWQRLTELTADYLDLRDAQERLMPGDVLIAARPAAGTTDAVCSDLVAANLDDLWPHWRDPRQDPAGHLGFAGDKRLAPWPEDPTEALLWLSRHAQLWIPTTDQLADLRQRRQDAANPNPHDFGRIEPHGDRFTERTTTYA